MPINQRAYTKGYFAVVIGGQELGVVQSVEGGGIKADVMTQPVGGEAKKVKNIGIPSIDPITLQVGASLSQPLYEWIENSWKRKVERRDGAIIHYNYDGKPIHEIEFKRALITETTVPALDGASKQTLFLTVKLQPEEIAHNLSPSGGRTLGAVKAVQKAFMTQNFRFGLDTVECGRVTKVESFTIKQNVKPLQVGERRFPEWEPTSLEYPNCTITTALDGADELFEFHKKFVIDGDAGADDETTGHITLLDPNLQDELLEIELQGVGIVKLDLDKADVSARNAVSRVRAELYVSEYVFKWKK